MKNWSTRLVCQIGAAFLGLYLAERFISGVSINGDWTALAWAGLAVGCLNFFIRPVLMIIALPIRILTFGVFSAIINMAVIWSATLIYPALVIPWFWPLFWTSLLIGLAATLISFILQ